MYIYVHVYVTIVIKEEVMDYGGKRKHERSLRTMRDRNDVDTIFVYLVLKKRKRKPVTEVPCCHSKNMV